jgi:hypothetical protein
MVIGSIIQNAVDIKVVIAQHRQEELEKKPQKALRLDTK